MEHLQTIIQSHQYLLTCLFSKILDLTYNISKSKPSWNGCCTIIWGWRIIYNFKFDAGNNGYEKCMIDRMQSMDTMDHRKLYQNQVSLIITIKHIVISIIHFLHYVHHQNRFMIIKIKFMKARVVTTSIAKEWGWIIGFQWNTITHTIYRFNKWW